MNAVAFYNMFKKDPTVLSELIEALKRIDAESKFPVSGDKFFFFDITGEIRMGTWEGNSRQFAMKDCGNCFRTEEEAAFIASTIQIRKKYRGMGHPFQVEKNNWRAIYDHEDDSLHIVYTDCASEGVYFSSETECREAIEAIGGKEVFIAYILESDN